MKNVLAMCAALSLSACAAADKIMPGHQNSLCDEQPDACMSASSAHAVSQGNVKPIPSDAALAQGKAARVWVAPLRMPNGVLTNSGYSYWEWLARTQH